MDRIEKYAIVNNIPIMQKDGIEFLVNYIKKNNVKTVLEIGSAIGYSAIKMALVDKSIKVVTIEKDKTRYDEALKNIGRFHLQKQINIINEDALCCNIDGIFDLIFIDAAKAQYIKFFEKYQKNLKQGGIIVSDNLNFHGLVEDIDNIKSKNLKALVKKINKYKEFLNNNDQFDTTFYNVGDGISISKKK